MSDNNKSSKAGIGVTGLLGVAFIILKLCGVIDWSWWWVLSPFWIDVLLFVIVAVIFAIVVVKREKRIKRW